jgi:hypothetical protein
MGASGMAHIEKYLTNLPIKYIISNGATANFSLSMGVSSWKKKSV